MLASLVLSLTLATDTTVYPVMNHGNRAGEMVVVRDADSVVVTYAHIDRNRGRWVQSRYTLDAAGRVVAGESRPMTRGGEVSAATDSYAIRGDSLRFERRMNDQPMGRTVAREGGFYAMANATAWHEALLVRHLLAAPARTARLLPGGREARLEVAADTLLPSTRGPRRVRLMMVHGTGASPSAVWVDGDGQLAASAVAWFITMHPDFLPAMDAMRAIESAYRDRAGNALAQRIPVEAQGTVFIRNADVFDSETGRTLANHSVLIERDRIRAVAPAASLRAPRGATVIDGTGKTLIPGMWDMHTHFQLTSQTGTVLRHLAIGVTGIRDMAADTDVGTSHRDRANDLRLVSPRVILGGFIEGPQQWAGPSAVRVSTEAEARAWVARYDSLGYKQVKLYNLVHPDLVPTIAAEAKARGMRVSGHIPRGLTLPTAVRLGFDEVNHAAFLFSTFYQDSLYWPEMRAYSLVARIVAPNIDVDGPAMTALLDDLKSHGTVVDGTFNLWMRDSSGADSVEAKASNRAYLRLIKRLHDTGVTLVAGTDGSSFNAELEHYEQAGIPAPRVLQIATLEAARVMGETADYGSIAVGKVADLVLVNGKPQERVRDARNVELVFRAGRAYAPKALTDAANASSQPFTP